MNAPEQETARISKLYAAMADGELEKLASSAYELNDIAHEALKSEIARRNLNFPMATHPGIDVYELKETVTIRQFRDLHEALLAKGLLDSAGIHVDLVDDNMVRLDWFYSNLIGGIKLKVRSEEADAANDILSQPIPDQLEVDGIGTYEQPRCPRCQSLDVSFQELNKLASFGSAYFGVPIPVHTKAWTCHVCRSEWEEDVGSTETNGPTMPPSRDL